MSFDQLLTTAVLLLAASATAIAVFHRAGFGPVLGLLATGIVFGPYTPGLTIDISPLAAATELGIVFLLFIIGLELEPQRLWAMRRTLFGLGTLQVVVTGLALTGVGLASGRPWQASLVLGFGLSLSSTAFVLQILTERGELGAEHGRAAFAILLLQDIAVVPLLALVPLLSPAPAEGDVVSIWLRLLLIVGTLAGVVVFGLLALPRAFAVVAKQRSAEAFAVLASLSVLVAAWVTHHAGLSPALGAFLMGVLLSRSPFHHQIEAEIAPFKGLLLGLFFITVGMTIDLGQLIAHWRPIVALVLALILVKGLVIFVLCRLFGLANAPALRTALMMTQGGEFGFVLFAAAAGAGVIGSQLHTTALLVISVSMAATPLLARLGEWLARRLANAPAPATVGQTLERHVVIAGYGRVGQAIATMLEQAELPFVAVELEPNRVLSARKAGHRVLYGNASDAYLLHRAGTGRAAALVVTLDRPSATERVVASVRAAYPRVTIVARAHDEDGRNRLERLGASIVVPETLELSLRLGEAALQRLGCEAGAIEDAVRVVRELHRRAAE